VWTADKLGKFTINSAIRILQASGTMNDLNWKTCWKTRSPHRIKFFLWLLHHQRLLTNAERFRRQLLASPQRTICFESEESLDHLLKTCSNARATWQALEKEGVSYTASDAEFQEWLKQNINGNHRDPEWPEKFAIILWYIWKWRCAVCLDNVETVPEEQGEFLVAKFREILNAMERDMHKLNEPLAESHEVWVHWEPPMRGWKVLNIDGAVSGNPGRAGAGGVIRGEDGEWIIGFPENVGHCSVVKAGLRAMLHGLKIAKEVPIHKLWVQSDSSTVVGLLNNPTTCHMEFTLLYNNAGN